MKNCIKCGSPMQDNQRFCNTCGADNGQAGNGWANQDMTVIVNNQQPVGYQPGMQQIPQQNMQPQQMGMQQVGMQPQQMGMQQVGMQPQQIGMQSQQMGMQQMGYPQGMPAMQPPKKVKQPINPSKKKGIIIGAICAAVVLAVVLVLVFVIKPGKKSASKKKAEEKVKTFFELVEDQKVEDVADAMISRELAKQIALDYGKQAMAFYYGVDSDDYDFDDYWKDVRKDLKKNFEDDYEDVLDDLDDELDDADVEIEFNDVKVKDAKKADLNKVISNFYDTFKDSPMDLEEETGYSADELFNKLESVCKDYEIDMDKIYSVDVSFTCEFEVDGEDEVEIFEDEDINIGDYITENLKHMYTYEYQGETYVIPGVEDMVMQLTALEGYEEYQDKATKANDIVSCKNIETAIDIALGNESVYEYLTSGDASRNGFTYIYFTPGGDLDGIKIVGPDTTLTFNGKDAKTVDGIAKEEIGSCLDNKIPELKYKDAASRDIGEPVEYCGVISGKGSVYMFIATSEGDMMVNQDSEGNVTSDSGYQIRPYLCEEYDY